jgi:peroxiredoxin-like protein
LDSDLLPFGVSKIESGGTMQAYPHHYSVRSEGAPEGSVAVHSEGLPSLTTAAPPQFGGPGGQWSPETLLVAAAADCFILTFRAIAAASKLSWKEISCSADGTLDRADGVMRFTELRLRVRLVLPADADRERAERLLQKAEKGCLITNSLVLTPTLETEIATE